jgi:hypothetical protein
MNPRQKIFAIGGAVGLIVVIIIAVVLYKAFNKNASDGGGDNQTVGR